MGSRAEASSGGQWKGKEKAGLYEKRPTPTPIPWSTIEPLIREGIELGGGKAGTVYKITLGGKEVAVKVTHDDRGKNELYLQWKAETNYLCELTHDNIIKMIHFSSDMEYGKLFVVYELMTSTVADRLQELNWSQTIQVLRKTAAALAFMHEQKPEALHNDIKPENILLDELLDNNFIVKLGDFGAATTIDKTPPVGTPGYTPNRDFLYKGKAHPKVDVYSFGVTSLQLLMKFHKVTHTKETARRGKSTSKDQKATESIVDIADQKSGHVVHEKLLQTGCSEKTAIEITDLIKQCCDIDPRKRPDMKDVLKTLEKLQ